MLFFEYTFIFVFLPIVVLVHALLGKRWRNAWLLLASVVFYAFTNLEFLPILLGSTVLDFGIGQLMSRTKRPGLRRGFLLMSVLLNLSILAYFKYSGLITTSLQDAGLDVPLLEAALPVGISFYTFQSMSYSIDLYRGKVPVARSLVDFSTFVTLFPQLIAGPIVRYDELHGQLREREVNLDRFASGVMTFVRGLGKKVLLADTAGLLCNPMFEASDPSCLLAWTAIALYGVQIYFDFSGYSDMAIGMGRMLGFEFPDNFNSPYKAESFSDFWRRWHMTLSRWLRDNLYIPLGGNRHGALRTYGNLLVTMLLGGLWHGASWNFLMWGAGHGLLLAVERLLGARNPLNRAPLAVRRLVILFCVTVLWVPFRCEGFAQTRLWLSAMFTGGGESSTDPWGGVVALCLFALAWLNPDRSLAKPTYRTGSTVLLAIAFLAAMWVGLGRDPAPFLYFRF